MTDPILSIDNAMILPGRRDNRCWFSPTTAVLPGQAAGGGLRVLVAVTMQLANDLGPTLLTHSDDLGETWSPPRLPLGLSKIAHAGHIFEQFVPGVIGHRASGACLAFGQTIFAADAPADGAMVKNERLVHDRLPDGRPAYAVLDPHRGDFPDWRFVAFPESMRRYRPHWAPCSQPVENSDGTLLIPTRLRIDRQTNHVCVARIRFDGQTLSVDELGPVVGPASLTSVCEPSLVRFGERYLMTLRSQMGDGRMYLTTSDDGLCWSHARPWCWDDGQPVETENTQQHWLELNNRLHLIYTRRNELSNGVFRSRAPLFIATVDADRGCLHRNTEQLVFPERGARMGNFCVVQPSDDEAWVLTGEWLEQHVADLPASDRFRVDLIDNGRPYNRNQFIGDLLLARMSYATTESEPGGTSSSRNIRLHSHGSS